MNFLLSPKAELDIEEISDYIFIDNPSASAKWLKDIFAKFDLIASMPEIGRKLPRHPRQLMILPFGAYIIIYEKTEKTKILIVRVIHAARQWQDMV